MTSHHDDTVDAVREAFRNAFGDDADLTIAMAPGRVNLVGEYTDFNDGFVFPMTLDRGVYVAVRPLADRRVRIHSVRYDEQVEYELDVFETPEPGTWPSYVLGVVEELRQRGFVACGFEAVVDGNLNLGAGLSSSAALEVATAVTLRSALGFNLDDVDMVKLCQHVEHRYANVLCGIMDQFACGIGRAGHALLLDCRSLEHEHVPVALGDYRIVITNSGVERSLASSAYNTRRTECRSGVEYFAGIDPTIRALRDVDRDLFDARNDGLSPLVRRRCRHVISENERALAGAKAMRDGELDRFGEIMTASHRSLRDDFEVSCPELDLLVNTANSTDGVLGSRMTGAGFGGCTVSLAHRDAVPMYVDSLGEYVRRFGRTPEVFVLERNRSAGAV